MIAIVRVIAKTFVKRGPESVQEIRLEVYVIAQRGGQVQSPSMKSAKGSGWRDGQIC